MSEKIPFIDMFPGCEDLKNLCGGLDNVFVTSVQVNPAQKSLSLTINLRSEPTPADLSQLRERLKKDYNLDRADIIAEYPKPEITNVSSPAAKEYFSDAVKKPAGKVIMGKAFKTAPAPMCTVTPNSGRVTIEGNVTSVHNKLLQKSGGAVLSFDISDGTNTILISKYIRPGDDRSILNKIDAGDHLIIKGDASFSKYDDDLIIDPLHIIRGKKETVRPDNAPEKRVELHAHTQYSAMDALTNPAALVNRAVYWGMPAVAVTDHGCLQAFPEVWHAAKGKNIKLIYGIECYMVNDVDPVSFESVAEEDSDKAKGRAKGHRYFHTILLVKNKVGLKNLYKMVSASYLDHFNRRPIIPKSLIMQHSDGIIIGSACVMGELFAALLAGVEEADLCHIASFYDYLEIQPLCNNGFLIDEGTAENEEELKNHNRIIIRLGQKLNKPVVATSDVHFLDAGDEIFRKILLAAQKYPNADRDIKLYLRNTEEMLAEFAYLGKEEAYKVVVTNTRAIADRIEVFELLPKELYPPKIEHSAEDLAKLVRDRMHNIYGENPPEIVRERVETELKTILDHNYDVIYMSAQKLVQNSLENGYLVGSRGSVGSSIVAYMSGITEVNSLPPHYVCPECKHSEFVTDGSYGCGADMPEKDCPECGTPMRRDGFDIPFETFLGFPGNEKTPDIDLNFSGEYQAKAHKYTETLFGSDHVFRAGTYGTLADKTALGYVYKYYEMEEHKNFKPTRAEMNRLVQGLVGVKRTTGQHPGGLVVIPQDMDVTDFCPVQHPADDPNSEIITTHFEYHCMEDNLLKLDELGHDDPTMIRMMEDMTGENARAISLSDPDTMSIFTSPTVLGLPEDDPIIGKTGTIGVPEFGTGFTRQMLVDTQPKQFNTLIRLSGFSHGTDVWAGNIHDLIVNGTATVDETVGCRDDIMLYLISLGMEPSLAFKFMEAVRKGAIHKGKKWPEGIEEKMKGLGVPEWWVESCRKIQYLFPKAHAVAYVMMAFRIAWFKVHRPLAFYSAYFYRRSQKGNFDAKLMTGGTEKTRRAINELKRRSELTDNEENLLVTLEAVYEFNMRGFSFAPLDIYESDAVKFLQVGDSQLRPPFVSLPGLGETAARELYGAVHPAEGKIRRFVAIDEICSACTKVSSTSIDQLKEIGALHDIPDSSQINFFDM